MGFQKYDEEDVSFIAFQDPTDRIGRIAGAIEVELTYALGQAYWKQGYATEAGRVLIPYGFQNLSIDRIVNSVSRNNPNTIHLMERLGFRIEPNMAPSESDSLLGILDKPATS